MIMLVVHIVTVTLVLSMLCAPIFLIMLKRKRERRIRAWALAEGYAIIKLEREFINMAAWRQRARWRLPWAMWGGGHGAGMLGSRCWIAELQDEQGGLLTVTFTFRWSKMDVERMQRSRGGLTSSPRRA